MAGIRFIDIRVGGCGYIVHERRCGIKFDEVLRIVARFLERYPSEGIIMRVSNCGADHNLNKGYIDDMLDCSDLSRNGGIVNGLNDWEPGKLTMQTLRRKVLLIGYGFLGNAKRYWAFNWDSCKIQDDHNSGAGGIHWAGHTKIPKIISFFNHVTTPTENDSIVGGKKLCINHLSCHGFWGHHPWMFARHCNDATLEWLRHRKDYDYQHYGVVAADF